MLRRPKLDGFRALLAVSSGGKVSTRSRRQRPLARYFLEIVEAAGVLPAGVRLDGELGTVLTASVGAHPWPDTLSGSRFGQVAGDRVSYTQVEPALVVEFEHDSAWERGRFRHPTSFVRLRPDLAPANPSPGPQRDNR
jgi:ATP-dependent DNA ligase